MSNAQQLCTVGGKHIPIIYDAFVTWNWELQTFLICFLEYRKTNKVQIPSNPECHTPSSRPFRIRDPSLHPVIQPTRLQLQKC
jgi:hypothetical protein